MSAGTLSESDVRTPAGGFRLGSFLLGRRIDEGPFGRRSTVTAEAVGVTGTAHDGRAVVVRCMPMTAASADSVALAEQAAAKLVAIQHPAIVPILEAGVAGEVAYVVEAKPTGTSVADFLSRQAKIPATHVRRLVAEVAAGLAVIHGAGLAHGRITPSTVRLSESGSTTLSGFVLANPASGTGPADPWTPGEAESARTGPTTDQYQLAITAAAALTGTTPTTFGGIRDHLPGVPSAVVIVLAHATAAKPEERYPAIGDFAQAFSESIKRAGDDLIAGVWEAISRRDEGMAAIMLEMAQGFAPDHPDFAMLRLRMSGGTVAASSLDLLSSLLPAASEPGGPVFEPTPTSPTTPEEAAIAALLMPPQSASAVPKKNPWVTFAMGTFFCFALLVIAAIVTLMYG